VKKSKKRKTVSTRGELVFNHSVVKRLTGTKTERLIVDQLVFGEPVAKGVDRVLADDANWAYDCPREVLESGDW
jgi:4-hydroxy-3-methylbut-2-enyl diphosphate reductase IspH